MRGEGRSNHLMLPPYESNFDNLILIFQDGNWQKLWKEVITMPDHTTSNSEQMSKAIHCL